MLTTDFCRGIYSSKIFRNRNIEQIKKENKEMDKVRDRVVVPVPGSVILIIVHQSILFLLIASSVVVVVRSILLVPNSVVVVVRSILLVPDSVVVVVRSISLVLVGFTHLKIYFFFGEMSCVGLII